MIQIDDFDLPITAAEKIIRGTIEAELSPYMETIRKAMIVTDKDDYTEDMFTLDEIKEIADYLTIYYQAHTEKGD